MLFDSISFLVFFPIVSVLYFLIPVRFQKAFLLLVSCFFYASFIPQYIFILFGLIVLDFCLAPYIQRASGHRRRVLLAISIVANLGMLFVFKYFNFFNVNLAALAGFLHWNYPISYLSLALPLGLSFHVFQSLSYVIEVYKGAYTAERNFLTYALYVMFFPQLVAGPIERPAHLLPQLKLKHHFDATRARRGLERMLWGFFKKLVIADNIAVIVAHIYSNLLHADGPTLLLLMVLFSYELYCDFSGYSDIAVGSALILGFELTENFNRPYASRSVAEFWRRWHISLSSWLRDYLYIPLGGSRVSQPRHYANLLITFILIGLWHGANWTFVAMGTLHGTYLVIDSITEKTRQYFWTLFDSVTIPRLSAFIQTFFTFILVTIGWVFFSAPSIRDAFFILTHAFVGLSALFSLSYVRLTLLTVTTIGVTKLIFFEIIVSILFLEIVQYLQAHGYAFQTSSRRQRWSLYYFVTLAILSFGFFGGMPFIYFQF
jgi:D-alanyl-lipoteichoic acid acyltransferase DltB (MBOAT superfamily)